MEYLYIIGFSAIVIIGLVIKASKQATMLEDNMKTLEKAGIALTMAKKELEDKDNVILDQKEKIEELEQAGDAKVLMEYQKRLRDLSVENSQLKQREADLNGIIERNKYMWKLNEEDATEMMDRLDAAAALIKEYEQQEDRLIKEIYRLRAELKKRTEQYNELVDLAMEKGIIGN